MASSAAAAATAAAMQNNHNYTDRNQLTGSESMSALTFEEFRKWIVDTQIFLTLWHQVFDPYEQSGFRSPVEVLGAALAKSVWV